MVAVRVVAWVDDLGAMVAWVDDLGAVGSVSYGKRLVRMVLGAADGVGSVLGAAPTKVRCGQGQLRGWMADRLCV